MRRLLVLSAAALAVALTAALYARAGAAGPARFRTPDAAAACQLTGTTLVCSSLGSPGSVALRSEGAATVVRRLPWWDAATPVLHSFHSAGISCRLAGSAILCRGAGAAVRVDGNGFAVTD